MRSFPPSPLSLPSPHTSQTFSLRGQDAWRNHPLLSGNHKQAIPHVRLAVGIFVGLVAVDWMYRQVAGK